ncbi:hypothetical protein MMC09_001218 [Bachmanniomyces sp. S44760]|nr:hypothetical protein [Bachmanniomyces sp. S44760]
MLLVCVMIGKVVDPEGLKEEMQSVQVKNNDPMWNCVIWVKDALAKLAGGKIIGTSQLDWQTVRDTVMMYVEEKKTQHRFDERAQEGQFDTRKAATFDLLTRKEVRP